jgi:predicted CXXCH cytochrome family protein
MRPLWNRTMPAEAYTIYTSRSLNAQPGQPTGTSKMCLSCHDGTIALGSVVSRGQPIMMSGGVTTLPAGHANIGTDLRDDHPISFRFDSALAGKNARLKDPAALPSQIRLDGNNELQCTACHDAHNNTFGNFLVMRNDRSELCISCHQMGTTTVTAHSSCDACHQPHTAPSGPHLLKKATPTDTCLACHDGSVAQAVNIASAMHRPSVHDTASAADASGPMQDRSSCVDCHDPHTMARGGSTIPLTGSLPANLGRVSGVSESGSGMAAATQLHQVCFKCHADGATVRPLVSRQIQQSNLRLKFSPSSVSFHPVEAPGRNSMVPSLLPGWTVGSTMTCTSCHSDDSGSSRGAATGGVHGSSNAPLLVARYEIYDQTPESASAYALCYRCHDRANILNDTSFKQHKLHIVDQRTPCAACHDAHGIPSGSGTMSGNSSLINFATTIVHPDNTTGRLEFRSQGMFAGQCFLSCHGTNHSGTSYPSAFRIGVPKSSNLPSTAPKQPGKKK